MAEKRRRPEPEPVEHGVQVRHLGADVDVLRLDAVRRTASPPLVVVDEAARVGEPVELRQQVRVVEVRPAVEDDERRAGADLAAVEPRTVDGDVPFASV
jgi:hypothetical protein